MIYISHIQKVPVFLNPSNCERKMWLSYYRSRLTAILHENNRQQIRYNEQNYFANQYCNSLDIFILFLYQCHVSVLFISQVNQKLVHTRSACIDRVLYALGKFNLKSTRQLFLDCSSKFTSASMTPYARRTSNDKFGPQSLICDRLQTDQRFF